MKYKAERAFSHINHLILVMNWAFSSKQQIVFKARFVTEIQHHCYCLEHAPLYLFKRTEVMTNLCVIVAVIRKKIHEMLFVFTPVISVNGSNILLFDLHSVRWAQIKSEFIYHFSFLFICPFLFSPIPCRVCKRLGFCTDNCSEADLRESL